MIRKGMKIIIMAVLCFACFATMSQAGIFYDEEKNVIRVIDYPEELPCTMKKLFLMDRMNGWGKVIYDKKTDTYTINCSLWIGANDTTATYFRIGSKEHPKETIVLNGDLVVYPWYIKGQTTKVKRRVNRLTLGSPDDKTISVTLKIDSKPGNEHNIYIGAIPAKKVIRGSGGQLHVYNSTITAAVQDKEHSIGTAGLSSYLTGDSIIFKNAVYSWVKGIAGYGMGAANSTIEDCTFEHCGSVIIDGKQVIKGCTFRNVNVAVLDWGSLDAVLTDCVFENNNHNWDLRYTAKGVVFIDCKMGTPKKGNICFGDTRYASTKGHYPSSTLRRHIIVEVVDLTGKPIKGVSVEVVCEQGVFDTVDNGKLMTDETGKTPGKGEAKVILLTEVIEKATDIRNKPEVTEYSYQIKVSKNDKSTSIKDFKPTENWKIVRIVI